MTLRDSGAVYKCTDYYYYYYYYRLNVVSVLIGYRFLEKFMFSFQTLHVLCELRKFLLKYRIMWPMPSYLFWNLAILFFLYSVSHNFIHQSGSAAYKYSFVPVTEATPFHIRSL